jgi:hypothetical protein
MSYLAYESGLEGGADDAVAGLTTIALEVSAIFELVQARPKESETNTAHPHAGTSKESGHQRPRSHQVGFTDGTVLLTKVVATSDSH